MRQLRVATEEECADCPLIEDSEGNIKGKGRSKGLAAGSGPRWGRDGPGGMMGGKGGMMGGMGGMMGGPPGMAGPPMGGMMGGPPGMMGGPMGMPPGMMGGPMGMPPPPGMGGPISRPGSTEDVGNLERGAHRLSAARHLVIRCRQGQSVERADNCPHRLRCHLGVEGRGVELGMAEQCLDNADIDAVLEQMRRKTVP